MTGEGFTEIERKFVLSNVPAPELLGEPVSMRQGYLAQDGEVAVRVRVADRVATLTVKAGSGLERVELDVPIDPGAADALWPSTAGRRVVKRRYRVALDDSGAPGLVAEVDVYADHLDGLCTVEVEFASTDDAERFTPPAWFGREVTGDPAWSNASLASDGAPR